jgi:hypothetical protein
MIDYDYFTCWVCLQGFGDIEDADMVLDPNNVEWVCCRCNNYETLMAAAERDQLTNYDPDPVIWAVPSADAMTVIFS